MKLLVVIVNFRTPDLVIECLESLESEMRGVGGGLVEVVENGSGDDSERRIREAIDRHRWSDWVSILVSERNSGFSGGNNIGIRAHPEAEFVLLLNSDTLVHRGCIKHCLEQMEQDSTIGALSCKLLELDGKPQTAARRFPTPMRLVLSSLGLPWRLRGLFEWADVEDATWDRETEVRDVGWLGGAFVMLRGDLLREIGGLDEDFFFYGEDIVLSHRVARAGYRRVYDARASITHLGGASSGEERLESPTRLGLMLSARYRVQRKCYGRLASCLVRLTDTVVWTCRSILRALTHPSESPKRLNAQLHRQLLWRSLGRAGSPETLPSDSNAQRDAKPEVIGL